jgi:hypothetical protein
MIWGYNVACSVGIGNIYALATIDLLGSADGKTVIPRRTKLYPSHFL